MTKEELKQEAEEWLCNNLHSASEEDFIKAMVDIAEPREKQIQIDAEQIRALQKQNGELTDELKSLRESIKDYGAGCYENGLRNGKRKLEAQIADLEKENAELKDYRLTTLAKQQTGMSKYALNLEHKLSWYDDQLTKAKELLERFLGLGNLWDLDCKDYFPLRKEAEQFLNSEGK